jgi:ATP/maltotriose-dependent transcriptional regulator MalT
MHGLDPAVWADGPPPTLSGESVGARMLAAETAWELLVACRERERAVQLARFALSDASLRAVDNGLLWVVAAAVLEIADEDVMPFWESTLADAYGRGSLFAALSVNLWRGYTLYRRGALREADESLTASNEQTHMWGAPDVGVPYGETFRVLVTLERGDLAGAADLLAHSSVAARAGDGARLWDEARAALFIAEGRWTEALLAAESVRSTMTSVDNPAWRPWRSLRAAPLAQLGRLEEAEELMREELALAHRWGAPSVVGQTLRRFGELGGARSEDLLREAVEVLRPTRARLQLARSLHGLAAVSADDRERRSLLEEALDLATACGADGLRRDVVAGLHRLGVEAPAAPALPPLTMSERRIADLAAHGASARDIAEELFLTPARVEGVLAVLAGRGDAAS